MESESHTVPEGPMSGPRLMAQLCPEGEGAVGAADPLPRPMMGAVHAAAPAGTVAVEVREIPSLGCPGRLTTAGLHVQSYAVLGNLTHHDHAGGDLSCDMHSKVVWQSSSTI